MWETETTKEDDKILAATAPISLAAPVVPVNFYACSIQDPANSVRIWAIYHSLVTASDQKVGILFQEIALADDRADFNFGHCMEIISRSLVPHIMLIYGLGFGPCFTKKEYG